MNRKWMIVVLISTLLTGCSSATAGGIKESKSTMQNTDMASSQTQNPDSKTVTDKTQPSDQTPSSNQNPNTNPNDSKPSVKSLTNEDFTVQYQNVSISLDLSPKQLVQKIGEGTANEGNNFGFIGNDPQNKFKYYGHNYPATGQSQLTVRTRVEIATAQTRIESIQLTALPTVRGIQQGDSLQKLLDIYGEPTRKENDDQRTVYIYQLADQSLKFFVSETKVEMILITR